MIVQTWVTEHPAVFYAKTHDFEGFAAHELALRVQHYSNAGIRHPNPGENFVQLRGSFAF